MQLCHGNKERNLSPSVCYLLAKVDFNYKKTCRKSEKSISKALRIFDPNKSDGLLI